uniref:GATA transcription factor n=1 Tax=Kalanchoe fedtschenkoi TaxID=63787 RepID=A0A7N0UBX6_KALFE
MECVESALKGSFRKEMTLKLNHQAVIDDLPAAGLTTLTADDFFVDDLLDFSEINAPDEEDNEVVVVADEKDETAKTCPGGLAGGEFGKEKAEACRNLVFKEGELSVPADDVADLEWLSHFVDDSFPGYSLTCPAAPLPAKSCAQPPPPAPPVEASVKPTRARSKRARNGVLGWSVSGSETSSSTSSSSSTSFSSSTTWLIYTNQPSHVDAVLESSAKQATPRLTSAVKKRKTRPPREAAGGPSAQPRRCSHCGVQKTPQWRAGPLGAKTLCNACGVRFKSGRLLPEYRPACSPTFSSELHSNHHRKVLEMRYKKELELPDAGSAPAVPSF